MTRTAQSLRQGPQQAAQLDDLARVEAVGRLVEHQQLGLVQHGLGDGDALPVAARQPADHDVADRPERQPLAGGVDARGAAPARACPRSRPMKCEEFVDPHVAVERGVLRHVAERARAPAWPSRTTSKPSTRTVPDARPQVAGEDAQDGGLARAVGAEQAHHLALLHLEGDVVDGQAAAVTFAQPFDARRRPSASFRSRRNGEARAARRSYVQCGLTRAGQS